MGLWYFMKSQGEACCLSGPQAPSVSVQVEGCGQRLLSPHWHPPLCRGGAGGHTLGPEAWEAERGFPCVEKPGRGVLEK